MERQTVDDQVEVGGELIRGHVVDVWPQQPNHSPTEPTQGGVGLQYADVSFEPFLSSLQLLGVIGAIEVVVAVSYTAALRKRPLVTA